MPISAQQNSIYESISMIHPSGSFMCHVSKKRANWYINKGLADWLTEDSFQLKFEPNGYGNIHMPYYSQKLENRCVVCGDYTEGNLNKHHVVPYVFRSRFPLKNKESNHHDILVVCVDCHKAYETEATKLKQVIATNYNVSMVPVVSKEELLNKKILSSRLLLSKIEAGSARDIPLDRVNEIKEFSSKELVSIVTSSDSHWADTIINKLLNEDKLFDFIKMWRQHFLDIMSPKYLPKHWSVDHVDD